MAQLVEHLTLDFGSLNSNKYFVNTLDNTTEKGKIICGTNFYDRILKPARTSNVGEKKLIQSVFILY